MLVNTMSTNEQLSVPSGSVVSNDGGSPPPLRQQPSSLKPSSAPSQRQKRRRQQRQLLEQQQISEKQIKKVLNAVLLIGQIGDKFGFKSQVYNDFLSIMRAYKSKSITYSVAIQRVSNLFKGHPDLINGFNCFLRQEEQIVVQPNNQAPVSMPSSVIGTPATAVVPNGSPLSPLATPLASSSFSSDPAPVAVAATTSVATKIPLMHELQQQHIIILPDPQSAQSRDAIIAVYPSGRRSSVTTPVAPSSFSSVPAPAAAASTCVAPETTPHQQLKQSPAHSISTLPDAQSAQSKHLPSSVIDSLATTVAPTGRPLPVTSPVAAPSFSSVSASAEAAAISVPPKTAPQQQFQQSTAQSISSLPDAQSVQSQTVEFAHAKNYVHKIKERLIRQPEKYKRCLEILDTKERERNNVKNE